MKGNPLFSLNKSRGRPMLKRIVDALPFYVFLLIVMHCFLGSCTEQASTQVSDSSLVKLKGELANSMIVQSDKGIDRFIASDPSISNFNKVMEDIHSLKTLQKMSSKQLILLIPENEAFNKLGEVEREQLLDKADLRYQHQFFKNSLILHDKKEGEWNGAGLTYGEQPIKMNAQTGTVSFNNRQARILKQINVEGGHLISIVDKILI